MLSMRAPEKERNPSPTPEPGPSPTSRPSPKPPSTSPQQKSPTQSQSPEQTSRQSKPKPKRPGRRLLGFDRRLGARFVAGTDEAGRGSLAGPLVVAGVLLDYACLRDHRVRPLALLNDSKQLTSGERETLFRAVVGCAEKICVRAVSPREIDANGLHRSNLAGLRAMLHALAPPAEACLVDGFRLGPTAPPHQAVVDGDEKSAAIAAASIVAKVVRDRYMRRAAALYPAYGFHSHVGEDSARPGAAPRPRAIPQALRARTTPSRR